MALPKCEHGVAGDHKRFIGQWNSPFSKCGCCGVLFPYSDQGSVSSRGFWSRTWQPKDRCGQCGGGYVEDEYKAPENRP